MVSALLHLSSWKQVRWIGILLLGILGAGCGALAAGTGTDPPVVCMVYPGEKGDGSYIDAGSAGLQRAMRDHDLEVHEYFLNNPPGDSTPVVTPSGDGHPALVLVMGYQLTPVANSIAKTYPDIPVIGIDTEELDGPLSRTVRFSVYGSSYLAGILAAKQTRSGQIGIIGGRPDPNVAEFVDGFVAGAREERPDITITTLYIADDPSGFADPVSGAELARQLVAAGTDVIFPVAGASGIGVIETAANLSGIWVIGVDTDQSVLAPGVVIASVLKNLDRVVYQEIGEVILGTSTPGSHLTGIMDGGSELRLNPRFESLNAVIADRRDDAITAELRYHSHTP